MSRTNQRSNPFHTMWNTLWNGLTSTNANRGTHTPGASGQTGVPEITKPQVSAFRSTHPLKGEAPNGTAASPGALPRLDGLGHIPAAPAPEHSDDPPRVMAPDDPWSASHAEPRPSYEPTAHDFLGYGPQSHLLRPFLVEMAGELEAELTALGPDGEACTRVWRECVNQAAEWLRGRIPRSDPPSESHETPRAREATCRSCGCTDVDCSSCVERTGVACRWVEADLCSACVSSAVSS